MKVVLLVLLILASHIATGTDAGAQVCPGGRPCGAVCCP
jgi:hypothetical protein